MTETSIARELVAAVRDVMTADLILASLAEKEVERLFKVVLPKSPFRGKVFAVDGDSNEEETSA